MAMSDELMTTIALRLEATVRVMLSRTPETENFDDVPRPFGGASLSHRPSSWDVPMLLMKSAPLSCLYEYRGDYKRNVRARVPITRKNIVAVPHVPCEARENRGSATHLLRTARKWWQCHSPHARCTGINASYAASATSFSSTALPSSAPSLGAGRNSMNSITAAAMTATQNHRSSAPPAATRLKL